MSDDLPEYVQLQKHEHVLHNGSDRGLPAGTSPHLAHRWC